MPPEVFQIKVDGQVALTGSFAEMRAAALRIGPKAAISRWHGTDEAPRPRTSAVYGANVPDSVHMSDMVPDSPAKRAATARNMEAWLKYEQARKPKELDFQSGYQDGELYIERAYDRYATHYRLTGPLAAVNAHVERLMREFHPAGYGTRVTTCLPQGDTGTYQAVVYRANSCD